GQRKLMAMRAAEVDAYRKLAEQVYGFNVDGNTTVADFVAQNDNVRAWVEAFIRGARITEVVPAGDGNYKATVELSGATRLIDCAVRNRCR
ncbi:MAG: LPP20 family lipoprotein, partial [Rhodocyclaceae bacterium]|nr:LPP20 family lipoprotein [Rhodocyclaceae bacterium]